MSIAPQRTWRGKAPTLRPKMPPGNLSKRSGDPCGRQDACGTPNTCTRPTVSLFFSAGLFCCRFCSSMSLLSRSNRSRSNLLFPLNAWCSDLYNTLLGIGNQCEVRWQLHIFGMENGINLIQRCDIDLEVFGDVACHTLYFECIHQRQQNAIIVLHGWRLTDKVKRNLDVNALAQAHTEEVYMDNLAVAWVALHMANQCCLCTGRAWQTQRDNVSCSMCTPQTLKGECIDLDCLRCFVMSKDIGWNDTYLTKALGRFAHYFAGR